MLCLGTSRREQHIKVTIIGLQHTVQRSESGCSRVWEGKCTKKAEGHSRLHTYPSQRTLGEGKYEGRFDGEGIWEGSGVPVMCSVGGRGSWYNLVFWPGTKLFRKTKVV